VLPLLGNTYTADVLRKLMPLGLDPDGFVNTDSVVDNSFAEHARASLSPQP
jgi:hypothetical protein